MQGEGKRTQQRERQRMSGEYDENLLGAKKIISVTMHEETEVKGGGLAHKQGEGAPGYFPRAKIRGRIKKLGFYR